MKILKDKILKITRNISCNFIQAATFLVLFYYKNDKNIKWVDHRAHLFLVG